VALCGQLGLGIMLTVYGKTFEDGNHTTCLST
jgi:hypothetical protein